MKIQIVSDLHLELLESLDAVYSYLPEVLPDVHADVVVLAGDIATIDTLDCLRAALDHAAHISHQVYYVLGNHEYYGGWFTEVQSMMRNLCSRYRNVTLLQTEVPAYYQDFNVTGDTLWFPDDPRCALYASSLNDYRRIGNFRKYVHQENEKFVQFMRGWSNFTDGGPPDIVVTHHLPTFLSISPGFESSPYNVFYANELEPEVITQAKLWIHGHSHHHMDYVYPNSNTRIVANPCGYLHQASTTGFIPGFCVEL